MEPGLLLVVSGPAGSGKGTVNKNLLSSPEYVLSVSATTRAPRPGETDGKEYHFISREAFLKMIADGDLLEYTEYCGNFYGTPRRAAEEVLASGRNLILEIEVEGAMNIKKLRPDAVLVMLLPPSYAEQEARLRGRATETEEKILARLERTKEELNFLPQYDYIVVNREGGIEECANRIRAIVAAEKSAVRRHPGAKADYLANKPL